MLKRLSIENFALVDKLEIEFGSAMNVLTGETGAGKSIIVGAISRLLGGKTTKDDIRSGCDLAIIEGEYEILHNPEIIKAIGEIGINFKSNITIRKEISLKRASRSFINDQPVNLSQLKTIALHLAELFGQHSHQQLLDEGNHLIFLDEFAGITELVDEIRYTYDEWMSGKQELDQLVKRKDLARKERELLLFQKDEIEKANISTGEEEAILAEKKILDSSQILGEKSSSILQMLEQDEFSAVNILNSSRKEMNEITRLDNTTESLAELLYSALINIEEFRAGLERYQAGIPDDPDRLEEINCRLDELYLLKRKYGGSEEAVLTTLDEISRTLESRLDVDEQIRLLESKAETKRKEYIELAGIISKKRRKAAAKLSSTVEKELKSLGIDSARFEFEFIYEDDEQGILLDNRAVKPFSDGLETGRFLISANPGEPLKPLIKTASGGEISRIMLALKSANKSSQNKATSLLVFDEIDAGIGGRTAQMVAERIASLAGDFQLLVVTHLHQIAAVSDRHFAVEKIDSKRSDKRKVITVIELDGNERDREIDRMISMPVKTE